jgi:hypothetical protein
LILLHSTCRRPFRIAAKLASVCDHRLPAP